MKSRVSCCNAALLRRVLGRTALLWGAYLLVWLVGMPANLLSVSEWDTALDLKNTVLSVAANSCHAVSFCYGLAMAWFLYLYLHRSRSANFFGALPLRRETQYLTNYLAGIVCSVVPNFLIMGATMLAGAANGVNLVTEAAIWFGTQTLTYVFYFSFAVLCAMLVGNLIAMPLLYVVLNFVVVVVEVVVKSLMQGLLYGFRFTGGPKLGFLSPFYDAVLDGNGPECRTTWIDGELSAVWFEGWTPLLVLAVVGVVVAVLAFFLHKYRRMEVAGDVMAIKPLKPVFLYVFTFGFALVGGTVLAEMLVNEMYSHNFFAIAACVAACTVVGYFLGEMILLRTLRVFRKRNFLRCGICLVVTVAALTCARLDVLGIEGYVPDPSEVAGVRLDAARSDVTDPVRIQQVIELHQEILDRKAETEALCRQDVWTPRMEIAYVLTDGKEVSRYYCLPVFENEAPDPDSLMYKYEEINNTPEMILARELPRQEMTVENIVNCRIHYYLQDQRYDDTLEPDSRTTMELWTEAMLPDFKAGNMGTVYQTDRQYPKQEAEMAVAVETYSDVSVEIELQREDSEHTEYYFYHIPATATYTMEFLMELGVPEESFYLVDD